MTKKISAFGVFAALMVIGGYILYFISKVIPIPGSKFIVMGPYLTLIQTLVLIQYPRFGTLSLINLVFGCLMIVFNPWMTLAIIISGFLADCAMLLPIWIRIKQLLAMGVYNGISLITSVCITNYITGNALYMFLDYKAIFVAFLISFLTGILGGYAGLKIDKIYLRRVNSSNSVDF